MAAWTSDELAAIAAADELEIAPLRPDGAQREQVDAAYRAKYRRFGASYVDPMVADRARAATLKLAPR